MINYLKTSIIFTLCCSLPVCATEFNLGIQLTSTHLDIRDNANRHVAELSNDFDISPTISISSKSYYISNQHSFGVQFQLDGNLIKVNQQTLHQNNQATNIDSNIDGYAIYAVPLFFYHFNRNQQEKWQIKMGFGLGLGYLNLSGHYQITHPIHPEFKETKNIKLSEVGPTFGFYVKVKKGNHAFLLYNFTPYVNDRSYQFQEYNPVFAYQYTINLNHLFY